MIAGLVLAGGRSRRFGSEKGLARLKGRPLLSWAFDVVAPCPHFAVSVKPGSQTELYAEQIGFPVLFDLHHPGIGPLAGIHAGLLWAKSRGARALAVIPCDMPCLPLDLVACLDAGRGRSRAAVAVACGEVQPACALWSIDTLHEIECVLACGRHPALAALLADLKAEHVHFASPAAFRNANTADDLEGLEASFVGELST